MASVAVSASDWSGMGRPAIRAIPVTRGDPVELSTLKGLFLANRRRLLGYLLAHGAADAAEDLLQDLWLRVESAPPPPEPSVSYLMRMAHNLMIDRARSTRQRVGRERAWHTDGPVAGSGEDETPGAERVLLSRERLRLIDRRLDELGPKTKEILYRHRVNGVPQRTLAEELGVSLSAVEKQLQKAYKAIAIAQLAAEGGQDDH